MSELMFTFQRDKAIETILYLAKRIADPTFHSINKLLYFSDKTSLERYGRFICGDDYFAMERGPVPTNTYDLMKNDPRARGLPFEVVNGHTVKALRDANRELFSESDIECLDTCLALYGNVPFWKRQDDSHDEAYKKAWKERGNMGSVRMPIESIAELLEDSEELIDYLSNKGA